MMLQENRFPRKILQKEIAKRSNTSVSTVSRVLSGKSSISVDVRTRVLDVAHKMQETTVTRFNRPQFEYPIKKIGVLIPLATKIDIKRKQFSWFIYNGLKTFARQHQIELKKYDYINEQSINQVNSQVSEDIDGLILFSLDENKALFNIHNCNKATVILNGEDPFMQLDSVSPCNRSAARLGTQVLIDKGHHKILHITCLKRETVRRRLLGIKETMADNGLSFSDDYLIIIPSFIESLAKKAMIKHIRQYGVNFTAIFAASDTLAMGAIKALQSLNINVPEQIKVLGFDNITEGQLFSPAITTIHIPKEELAIEAFHLLEKRYVHPLKEVQRVELGCKIIYRSTL